MWISQRHPSAFKTWRERAGNEQRKQAQLFRQETPNSAQLGF